MSRPDFCASRLCGQALCGAAVPDLPVPSFEHQAAGPVFAVAPNFVFLQDTERLEGYRAP